MNRHRQIPYTCSFCGKPFTRSSRLAYRYTTQGQRPFCCHACYAASKRVNNAEEDGSFLNIAGYRVVKYGGKSVLEHRLVAEQTLGRKLEPLEHVHHVSGDKLDNRPENLLVVTKTQHSVEHNPLGWCIETAKALREKGWTLKDIGEKFSVTAQAIHSAFRNRGLTFQRGPNGGTWADDE